MKQPSFIDTCEAQAEYVKAVQGGYGFTRHGNRAHYLFTFDQIEPSVREAMPRVAPFYIWTFTGCTMASMKVGEPGVIFTAIDDAFDWTRKTPNA